MQTDDLVLVSVDDHVIEPPDMFEGRLAARYQDRAPRVEEDEAGRQAWVFEGNRQFNIGTNAVAGRPREQYNVEPARFDEMRPGCWDVDARVRDMNANGQLGGLCFPTFVQFCGQFIAKAEDKDLARAVVEAYNDWHIDSWAGAYPDRFIPLAIPPLWDPDVLAAEVRRVAAKGCRAITFSENPAKLGLPSLHSDSWDPFWRACADEGTIVCMHIGSSSTLLFTALDAPADVMMMLAPVNAFLTASDLIFSRVLRDFPGVRFALSEGGIGWIPYLLDRANQTVDRHSGWTGQDFGDVTPAQLFRDRVYTCFIDDPVGLQLRHEIGIDRIMWECDYPHSDSTWPHGPETAMKSMAGIPDDEIDKITYGNAAAAFGWNAVERLGRSACTVGALRAQASDLDTTFSGDGPRSRQHMSTEDVFKAALGASEIK